MAMTMSWHLTGESKLGMFPVSPQRDFLMINDDDIPRS